MLGCVVVPEVAVAVLFCAVKAPFYGNFEGNDIIFQTYDIAKCEVRGNIFAVPHRRNDFCRNGVVAYVNRGARICKRESYRRTIQSETVNGDFWRNLACAVLDRINAVFVCFSVAETPRSKFA